MSRWGTAVWGTDTWDAITVAELCQRPPAAGRGALIGIGDWRLVVEALLPSDGPSIWGVGVWGEAQWNVFAWEDLTPWVRGLDWSRGSDEPYGRPRAGDLTITLDSTEDRWSPWNPTPPTGSPAYFAPGTIVRVGVRSATDPRASGWLPQITCIVDTWGQTYVGLGADRYVDVTAVETLRDLATIDDNALPGVVGGGEDAITRIGRLLDAAGWKYGLRVEAQHRLDPADGHRSRMKTGVPEGSWPSGSVSRSISTVPAIAVSKRFARCGPTSTCVRAARDTRSILLTKCIC